jgi:hypothetical protein
MTEAYFQTFRVRLSIMYKANRSPWDVPCATFNDVGGAQYPLSQNGIDTVKRKKKALCALAFMIFLGASLMLFILASDEQSVLSSGLPAADTIPLRDLITEGPGKNKHIELVDSYIGKQYIYARKMVEFKEVYLPLFPKGQPEIASNLHLLLWIRNDRNSDERLIENEPDLDRFVAEFNRSPRSIIGVLRTPIDRVRTLTADAYPGTDRGSLQILRARNFPSQQSVNVLWSMLMFCLAGAAACALVYWRYAKNWSTRQQGST